MKTLKATQFRTELYHLIERHESTVVRHKQGDYVFLPLDMMVQMEEELTLLRMEKLMADGSQRFSEEEVDAMIARVTKGA